MRLIDADEFIKKLDHVPLIQDAMRKAFNNMPIYIDIASVVRCKDCEYFDHSDFGKGEEYWCKYFVSTDDTAHCHKVMEEDFCAWGERREDVYN